ncbi:MAG: PIG-L family deacetylase [Saprospiraceae bacterium]|nr:PIG-L family deacetylase [Saprospiraceae bacterium]
MRQILLLIFGMGFFTTFSQSDPSTLRVIVVGAHPDDCDIKAGGTAALFAQMGHAVKFLSLTNGDAGHQTEGGGALARRRRAEAKKSGEQLGVVYETLDNHDAELIPTLEVRHQLIRHIRKWDADVVIGHRPNDYHPDHRNAGKLVQDAAFLVIVPNVCSDTPPLEKNPLFLYMEDRFQRPNPFSPDIVVDIGPTLETKIDALDAHESQMYEWLPWINDRSLKQVPKDHTARKIWLGEQTKRRSGKMTPEKKECLVKWYGQDRAKSILYTEAFEIAEYGLQPNDETIRELFPILPD